MSVRAASPVSPVFSNAASESIEASSVGHSSELNDEAPGCLCYSCGDPSAAKDEDFLYLFRPHEGHSITLCERKDGQVIDHKLERIHFGNTRYLRQFLKPALHYRPLKFDVGQLCRDHQRGWCQRGPMCRFIHICRKLPLKAPSPYQQYGAGATDGVSGKTGTSGFRHFSSPSERSSPIPSASVADSVRPQVIASDVSSASSNIAFGDFQPTETTVQSLLAALHASMTCANNIVAHPSYTPQQPLVAQPTQQQVDVPRVNPNLRLNPEAEAYQPLGFIPQYLPRTSTAPDYSVLPQYPMLNASQVQSFVAPPFAPNNNTLADSTLMPQFMGNQRASMVDLSLPASCMSSPSSLAVCPPSRSSPASSVPASIADIWKTPMTPATSCSAAANSGCGSGVVGSESSALNTMLDSLRSFAMSFAVTSQ